jgi:hypothetical protein
MIAPRLLIDLNRGNGLPKAMAVVVNEFLAGKINSKIEISNIYFGTSYDSKNNLLSSVKVDVAPFLIPFVQIGPQINGLVSEYASIKYLEKRQAEEPYVAINGPFGTEISLNAIDVSFEPNSRISANVSGSLKLPFPVDISIPYFAVRSDIDNVTIGRVISGLKLEGSNPRFELMNSIDINDTEELADKIALIGDTIFKEGSLIGNLFVGEVYFGISPDDNIDMFSQIGIDIVLKNAWAKFLESSGITFPAIGDSLDALADLFEKYNIKLDNFSLSAGKNKSLNASVHANFQNPVPFRISGLDYLSVVAAIDNTDLVQVTLPGFPLSLNKNELELSTKLHFPSSSAIKSEVKRFGEDLMNFFGKTKQIFTTHSFSIGVNGGTQMKLFSKLKIPLASKDIFNQENLNVLVNTVARYAPNYQKISDILYVKHLDIEFTDQKTIEASSGVELNFPFIIALSIPYIQVTSNLDNIKFADFSIYDAKIDGSKEISINTSLAVADSERLADSFAKLIAILLAQPTEILNTLRTLAMPIGGGYLNFGIDDSVENVIDTFSDLAISVPIKTLTEQIFKLLPVPNVTEIAVPDLSQFGFQLGEVSLTAEPRKTIKASVAASFENSFPVTVTGLGYIHSSAGIDDVNILNVNVEGFSLGEGTNSLELETSIVFPSSPEIKKKVSDFGQSVTKNFGNSIERIGAHDILFGYGSDTDKHFKFLSKAKFYVGSSDVFNEKTVKYVVDMVANSTISSQINSTELLDLVKPKSLDVKFTPEKTIETAIAADVDVPFNVTLSLPYVKFGSSMNQVNFVDISVFGTNIGKRNNQLEVDSVLNIKDTDQIADIFADLVSSLLAQPTEILNTLRTLDMPIGGGYLNFGIDDSVENVIDTFSDLAISIPIKTLTEQIFKLLPVPNVTEIAVPDLSQFGFQLGEVSLTAEPRKTIKASVAASFENSFPVTVTGLGYIHSSAGIDDVNILNVNVEGFSLGEGTNSLELETSIVFPSSPEIKKKVSDFGQSVTKNFGNSIERIGAHDILFGYGSDTDKHFKFLSKAKFYVGSSDVFNEKTVKYVVDMVANSTISSQINSTELLDLVKPKSLDVKFTPEKTIETAIAADVDVPFNVTLSLPYVKFGTSLNQVKMFDIAVLGTNITEGNNQLEFDSTLTISDTDELADAITDLFKEVFKNTTDIYGSIRSLDRNIGGGSFSFGIDDSAENLIDTFSEFSIEFPIKAVVAPILDRLEQNNSSFLIDLSAINQSLNLNLHNLHMDTKPGRLIGTYVSLGFTSVLQISVEGLGYFSCSGGIMAGGKDNIVVAEIAGRGISITPGINNVTLSTDIHFPKNEGVEDIVAAFAQNLQVNLGSTNEILTATGIKFGFSEEIYFNCLSRAKFGVPSSQMLNRNLFDVLAAQLKKVAEDIDFGSYIANLYLAKLHLKVSNSNMFFIDFNGGINNITFEAESNVGFLKFAATIDKIK